MLSDADIDRHIAGMTPEQADALRRFRAMVRRLDSGLEEVLESKGMFAGMLSFRRDGVFTYAIGPRPGGKVSLHLYPYYASPDLQERHGEAMKKVLSGKSCLAFRRWDELPLQAIEDSVRGGSLRVLAAQRHYEEHRRRRNAVRRSANKGKP